MPASLNRRLRSVRQSYSHASTEEIDVPEKSPQKPASKKAGKTLKEKREAKREKKANGRSS
jgi:hypothetical protein